MRHDAMLQRNHKRDGRRGLSVNGHTFPRTDLSELLGDAEQPISKHLLMNLRYERKQYRQKMFKESFAQRA